MDKSNKNILVIIPAYNEERNIGEVIRSIHTVVPSGKVLVIDDCSTDDTGDIAVDSGALVVRHQINLGYGSSLETGYLYALKNGYDLVVQMDGDGQHLAEEIPALLDMESIDEADIIIGSRYAGGDGGYRPTFARRAGHRFFSVVYTLMTGLKINDPTSGFQCLNRNALDLYTRSRFPDDYPDVDVLLIAHFSGLRIREIPVVMNDRTDGVSMHSGLKPLYYIVKMLLSVFMAVLNHRRWIRRVS
ncbi:glycosyltransferase family 2 protein [Candidatus Latescibacterota bacterium]